jgi:hypothetical protein
MLPKSEAMMRMCVLKVGQKGDWSWRDWTRWKLLWRFFPWYARNMRYRGFFCVADDCMHWHWENDATKCRGFCSHADSRITAALWRPEKSEPPAMTGQGRPRLTG